MGATRYFTHRRNNSGLLELCQFFSSFFSKWAKRSSFGFFCICLVICLSGSAFFSRSTAAAAGGPPTWPQTWLTRTVNSVRAVAGRWGLTAPLTGVYSGTVYLDYNANGVLDTAGTAPNFAIDTGVAGVVITAYNGGGSAGSTTSAANGTYSFTPTGSGPYRLEFTALPAGYTPSAFGANNGTSVRFVANGGAAGLDFGLVYATDYAQNDTEVVTNCYVYGNQASTSNPNVADSPVLVSFPYSAGATDLSATSFLAQYDAPANHQVAVPAKNIGTTFGLAYARRTRRIYTAAFFKRHAGFGKGADGTIDTSNGSGTGDDAGALYQINRDTNAVINTFTVPNATANKHNTSNYSTDNGNGGWDGVGKTSLGGMDIAPDETTLYVMNLENRTLYALNISAGTFTNSAVPTTTVPLTDVAANYGTAPKAAAGDVRPFAVRYYRGLIYVGLICTGESTNSISNLYAHVYTVNPATLAFSANPVFSARLNYVRGLANATGQAEWQAWSAVFANVNSSGTRVTYPQPVFTDIMFDNGNLVLGLRDRTGDQVGNNTMSNPANATLYQPRDAGDVVRACGSVAAGWTLESNGRCGGTGSAPQNSGQGPGSTSGAAGSGEFYYGDAYTYTNGTTEGVGSNHDEVALGTMAQLPGALDMLFAMWDPIPNRTDPLDLIHDGGMRWLHNSGATAGKFARAYRLYDGSSSTTDQTTFGKAAGLGEVELMIDPAPLQIGNRVWNDANANGVQDPGETGLANVVVDLYAGATRVGTATTDANGNYYFGGAANVSMLSNPACTGNVTAHRIATYSDDAEQTGTTVSTTGPATSPLSLARTGGADNFVGLRYTGLQIPKGATITNATLQFTADATPGSGTVNVFIDGEAADNAATFNSATASDISNRTVTSGANRVSWSPAAWTASTADATSTTPDLKNLVQEIVNRAGWQTGNALNLIIRNNGTTGTNARNAQALDTGDTNDPGGAGTSQDTQPNAAGQTALLTITYTCPYTIAPSTNYEVRIPSSNFSAGQPLNGFVLTDVNADFTTNGDARDTDATYSGGNVAIALTTGVYGDHNHTYDFGFTNTSTVSLGNRVWNDVNNNGVLDAGETGLANVTVNLYDAAGTTLLGTTTTDASGYYSFPGLTSGTAYVIELAASNFNSGGALDGYRSSLTQPNGSETAPPNPNTNTSDTDDNGQTSGTLGSGGVIRAQAVTVTAGSAPTGEVNGAGDLNPDNRSNLTVDFGLFQAYTVGNRVWLDNVSGGGANNNDGTLNGSETGISGVTVSIYADNDSNGVPDGVALATVTTDSNGYYRFDGLVAGKYVVGIPAANFGAGQPLASRISTTTTATSSSNSTDGKDNGVDNAAPGTNGIFSGTFNLATKTIPTGETDNQTPGTYGVGSTVNGPPAANSRGDLTIDFGFIPSAPLAARLSGFTAQAQGGLARTVAGAPSATGVIVRWSTGFEADNLGFNLYRESGGTRVKVNASLIAGSALLAGAGTLLTAGNSYAWPDAQGTAGTSYWLEAIDLSGARDWFGPVFASGSGGDGVSGEPGAGGLLQRARMLEELNAPVPDTAQTEYAAAIKPSTSAAVPETTPRVAAVQRTPWALPGQTAAKLLVRQDGWYRVTAAELQAAGFNTAVNPVLLQLFAAGVEVPITAKGKGDNVEYLEFYGRGLDTPATDTRVYWLVAGQQAGRRWRAHAAQTSDSFTTTSFVSTVERKDKLIYFSSLLNGEAENWFGPVINGAGVAQRLTTQAVNRQALSVALLEVTLQGVTEQAHVVNLEFNGQAVGTANFTGKQRFTASFPVPLEAVGEGANELRLAAAAGASDISLSEVIRLSYPRSFVAAADSLQFSLVAGQSAYISGFSTPEIRLLELGPEPEDVRELTVKAQAGGAGYGFALQSAAGATYVALTDARLAHVAGVKLNQPSNWRATTNAAEFVIVTHRDFWAAANRLAALRRLNEMRVAVVDIEDVYDEFNYGVRSPQALKDLLTYARANWLRKPSFALFLGDATNDPRNYLGLGEFDFVPARLGATSYFETALDNWFVDANDDGVPEYALGRLPVRMAAQAELAVNKTLAFKLPTTPRNSLFVSDRTVEGVNFKAASEQLANQLPALMSKQFINRNDAASEQVRDQIVKSINLTAPLVVNWQGHGSTQVWTGDGLLRVQDAAALTNTAPGLFVMTTCLNGYFTDPQQQSLGEAVLLNTPGGAFAVIASSALNQPGTQQSFNLLLYQYLFGKGMTLGEALIMARTVVVDQDVRNTYVLFGDPTLRVVPRR